MYYREIIKQTVRHFNCKNDISKQRTLVFLQLLQAAEKTEAENQSAGTIENGNQPAAAVENGNQPTGVVESGNQSNEEEAMEGVEKGVEGASGQAGSESDEAVIPLKED